MTDIPFELKPYNRSEPLKLPSEQKYTPNTKPYSRFGKMLEYGIENPLKYSQSCPSALEKLQPRKVRKIVKFKPRYPEPASYLPNYSVTLPRPVLTNLHYEQGQRHKTHLKQPTLARITADFTSNLRDFDIQEIERKEDQFDPDKDKIGPKKIISNFEHQAERKTFFDKPPITSNLPDLDPPQHEIRGLSFETQNYRHIPQKVDQYRDYHSNAIQQIDGLQSKAKILTMSQQIARDYVPPKNEKVEFMNQLKNRQNLLLKTFVPPRTGKSKESQPKGGFERQVGRDSVFTHVDVYEPKLPLDVERSLKSIWPKIPDINLLH